MRPIVKTHKWNIQEMSDDNHKPVVIGGLELDYPERKNCFSEAMYTQCIDALVQFEVDPEIVCVIITGAGDIFSSGADLKEGIADYDVVQRFMVKVITYSKILVAAVNGPAIGIGVTLLPHCDLVFASEQATFWTPFSRIAVVPEFCSSFLFPQIMVWFCIKYLLYFVSTFYPLGSRKGK